jgi:DNA-binding CsgD family transcriptional regulator
VHDRLLALPAESRDFLLAAAAHAHPRVPVVEAASGVARDAGLGPALEAGIVELDGSRIAFMHPLLGAGAYETADPLRRAEIHTRLAELLEDPEARAWQLAAAVDEPDEVVASVLEEAANHARARGAPRPAALLLERARELTPARDPGGRLRRSVDGAFLHFEAGDSRRAEAQLDAVITGLAPGPERARALVRLARVRSYDAQDEAAGLFLQAVEEADDPETLAMAHEGAAACWFRLREHLPQAVEHATVAADLALGLDDEALAAEATGTRLISETLLGLESAAETARRALALQDAAGGRRVLGQPLFALAVHWWWTDAFGSAGDAMAQMLARAEELGDESSVPYVLVLLGRLELTLGRLEDARGRALAGQEAAAQAGQETLVAYHVALEGLVEAHRGDAARARALAADALARVPETGGRPAELVAREALGHVGLALGEPGRAHDGLEPGVAFARLEATVEPAAFRLVSDDVESLVELGRLADASELLEWYEGNARRLGRTSALALCARARGLLAAADGRLEEAESAYRAALAEHDRVDVPLDRGRTLLALGVVRRRLKRRREARATLEEALALFERMGAALWAERAHAELKRISGRAPALGALTPAEERVAALVAEGKTNREVAAALFLSDRTVEGHLSHVFGKLGIRHRAELARALDARESRVEAPPNAGESPVSAPRRAP